MVKLFGPILGLFPGHTGLRLLFAQFHRETCFGTDFINEKQSTRDSAAALPCWRGGGIRFLFRRQIGRGRERESQVIGIPDQSLAAS